VPLPLCGNTSSSPATNKGAEGHASVGATVDLCLCGSGWLILRFQPQQGGKGDFKRWKSIHDNWGEDEGVGPEAVRDGRGGRVG
jgi:hypothetical protein